MVSPEFFASCVTFPVGATAIVLIFGGLTFFFGKLIDEILVEDQEDKDRQVLGALFIVNKIFWPFLAVGVYLYQDFVPVFTPGALFSTIGVLLVGGIYSAQSKLGKMQKFELHRTERFEKGVEERFEGLPDIVKNIYYRYNELSPLEFIQKDLDLAASFLLSKKVFFVSKFLFAFFLVSSFISGNTLAMAFSAVFAFSGYSLMAVSWAYYNSDYVWSIVETKSGEAFEGRIISSGDKVVIWTEKEKIEVDSEEIAVKRQSKWKDEKLEVEEDES